MAGGAGGAGEYITGAGGVAIRGWRCNHGTGRGDGSRATLGEGGRIGLGDGARLGRLPDSSNACLVSSTQRYVRFT